VALATIHELNRQGWNIPEESIRQGLATVQWPARMEILSRRPVVILDSAHNTASIAALMEVLNESFSISRRLLLFAATREKDFQEMLKLLLAGVSFSEIVFTQYTTNPRALPPAELESVAFQLTGRHYPIYTNPADAWNHLRQLAAPDDLICITGSFFLAGEMRRLMNAPMLGA
jgi:dihydrofolate synthase/folylpolyglutamate synthase